MRVIPQPLEALPKKKKKIVKKISPDPPTNTPFQALFPSDHDDVSSNAPKTTKVKSKKKKKEMKEGKEDDGGGVKKWKKVFPAADNVQQPDPVVENIGTIKESESIESPEKRKTHDYSNEIVAKNHDSHKAEPTTSWESAKSENPKPALKKPLFELKDDSATDLRPLLPKIKSNLPPITDSNEETDVIADSKKPEKNESVAKIELNGDTKKLTPKEEKKNISLTNIKVSDQNKDIIENPEKISKTLHPHEDIKNSESEKQSKTSKPVSESQNSQSESLKTPPQNQTTSTLEKDKNPLKTNTLKRPAASSLNISTKPQQDQQTTEQKPVSLLVQEPNSTNEAHPTSPNTLKSDLLKIGMKKTEESGKTEAERKPNTAEKSGEEARPTKVPGTGNSNERNRAAYEKMFILGDQSFPVKYKEDRIFNSIFRILQRTAKQIKSSVCTVTIVTPKTVIFKCKYGTEDWIPLSMTEEPKIHSIDAWVVTQPPGEVYVISDASKDPVFSQAQLTKTGLIYYAGISLVSSMGNKFGVLSVRNPTSLSCDPTSPKHYHQLENPTHDPPQEQSPKITSPNPKLSPEDEILLKENSQLISCIMESSATITALTSREENTHFLQKLKSMADSTTRAVDSLKLKHGKGNTGKGKENVNSVIANSVQPWEALEIAQCALDRALISMKEYTMCDHFVLLDVQTTFQGLTFTVRAKALSSTRSNQINKTASNPTDPTASGRINEQLKIGDPNIFTELCQCCLEKSMKKVNDNDKAQSNLNDRSSTVAKPLETSEKESGNSKTPGSLGVFRGTSIIFDPIPKKIADEINSQLKPPDAILKLAETGGLDSSGSSNPDDRGFKSVKKAVCEVLWMENRPIAILCALFCSGSRIISSQELQIISGSKQPLCTILKQIHQFSFTHFAHEFGHDLLQNVIPDQNLDSNDIDDNETVPISPNSNLKIVITTPTLKKQTSDTSPAFVVIEPVIPNSIVKPMRYWIDEKVPRVLDNLNDDPTKVDDWEEEVSFGMGEKVEQQSSGAVAGLDSPKSVLDLIVDFGQMFDVLAQKHGLQMTSKQIGNMYISIANLPSTNTTPNSLCDLCLELLLTLKTYEKQARLKVGAHIGLHMNSVYGTSINNTGNQSVSDCCLESMMIKLRLQRNLDYPLQVITNLNKDPPVYNEDWNLGQHTH
ncbi:hypothetical protein HK098_005546 [Nowakowskiella sp. JEL0407]|nr:hypothetical protein HK098_005546 [Nowakowskiella sp. JEL0407]